MDNDSKDQDANHSTSARETDGEQSFVGKFKSSVSEIISNTPLSKWFRKQNTTPSTVRRREDDPDEDLCELQPPSKRTRLPTEKERLNIDINDTLPSPINSVTNLNRINFSHFPEPMVGPSVFQSPGTSGYNSTRKVLNSTSILLRDSFKNGDLVNNDLNKVDSDSEASTSGYSSGQLASKVVSQESSKQASPQENSPVKSRSLFSNSSMGHNLFAERGPSPHPNSSASSRGPSFTTSSFGSSSFVDRTLSTKRILNSPFYSGRTVYGGAAAYGRSSGRTNQDLRRALKNSIQIKPVNRDTSSEKSDLQLGKTARRILDTLEQYSSPVIDAKKIPISPKKPKEGLLTRYTGANPYSLLRERRTASNRELQVPSVTDLLRMKQDQQKTRLQDSTEAVRQIANKSKISREQDHIYKIPSVQNQAKHTGKMKSKITNIRQKPLHEETMPQFKLNPVALPIKDMPRFNVEVPPLVQQSQGTEPTKASLESKSLQSKSIESDRLISVTGQFKFSAPLVLGKCEHPIKALNNFKFSEPLVKKRRSIHPELDAKETTIKNNGENFLNKISSPPEKSLMNKFKPAEGTWECSMCMIRNQPGKVTCVACETAKPDSAAKKDRPVLPPTSFAFGDKFKPSSNTWECPSCMIRNKEDLLKCVACETAKPDAKAALIKTNATTSVTSGITGSGFGSQFTPSASTWECPTCMIRNKDVDTKCVACETVKPGAKLSVPQASVKEPSNSFTFGVPATTNASTFGSKFAPPPNTWECPSCMLRNKEEVEKCVACVTQKPGASKTSSSNVGFKKQDEWECEMCLVRNKSTLNKCQCCESPKPGTALTTTSSTIDKDKTISSFSFGVDKATTSSFSFGVPPAAQQTNKSASSSFTGFGTATSSSNATSTPSFSFGVPVSTNVSKTTTGESAVKADSPKTKENSSATPNITFGVPVASKAETTEKPDSSGAKINPLLKPSEKLPEKAKPAATGFSFGLVSTPPTPKSDNSPAKRKAPSASTTSTESPKVPSFSFKPPTTNADVNKVSPFANKNKDENKSAGFQFSFGSTSKPGTTTSTTPALTNNVAAPNSSTEPSKGSMIKFGAASSSEIPKSTPPANNGFSFGSTNKTPLFGASAPNSTITSEAPKPFAFGGTAPTSLTTESAKAPNFSLGSSAPLQEPAKAPSFSFGGTTENKSNSRASNFGFGGGSSMVTSAEPEKPAVFSFGSDANKASSGGFGQATTPSFGQTMTNNVSAPTFGQSAPSSNLFGQAAAVASANPFGSATSGTSGFGQSATQVANPFAQSNATPAPNAAPFGQSAPTPTFSFGGSGTAAPKDALFGSAQPQQSSNSLYNFGSGVQSGTGTSQNAGFSFGSSNTTTNPGGFNFGSAATAPAASGGFNFSGSAPTFDANAKPSFNFTGGASVQQFSADVSQAAPGARRIKKAVRRTVR